MMILWCCDFVNLLLAPDILCNHFSPLLHQFHPQLTLPHITRYILNPHNEPSRATPVFRSEKKTSFEEWLSCWTGILLQLVVEGSNHGNQSSNHGNNKLASLLIPPLKIITSTQTGKITVTVTALLLPWQNKFYHENAVTRKTLLLPITRTTI